MALSEATHRRIAKGVLFLLKAGIAAAVVLTVGFLALQEIGPWSLLYHHEGQFQQLPPDDDELIARLSQFDRVIAHSIQVIRVDSEGTIRVRYGIGGRRHGRRHPDLDSLSAAAGYHGLVRKFREISPESYQ